MVGCDMPRSLAPLTVLRRLDELRRTIDSIGGDVWVAGVTAAALLGFDGFELKAPFHLAVRNGRVVHRHGVIIHRLRDIERLDTTRAMGLPCLSATRVLLQLAATEPPKRLTLALDSAVRDGVTAERFLHRRLVELRRRGRKGPSQLLAVIAGVEVTRGGHSFLEREFLAFLAEEGYPRPDTQQVLARRGRTLVRVDFRFPGTNVVVEVLGYSFHRSPMQMQADTERLTQLQMEGFLVVQFTYADVVTRAPRLNADLRGALGAPGPGASVKPQNRT